VDSERRQIDNPADALLWLDWGGRFLTGDYALCSADCARVLRLILVNSERQACWIERLEAEIAKSATTPEAGNG
jgi:hypothetical protein